MNTSSTPTSTVLVTGAAGNIGRAVATRAASNGHQLVLADHPAAATQLDETAAACTKAGASGIQLAPFDVTDTEAVAAQLAAASAALGPATWVFNNAGYQGAFQNIVDYDTADMRKVLAVNVEGVFNVLQAGARELRAAGVAGSIVNMASMAGVGGAPNMSAYSASKAAVIGLTKSASKDLAADDIRVNAVSPGFIGPGVMWDKQVQAQADTDSIYFDDDPAVVAKQMIGSVPLRRYGSLDEVADTVLFLLSEQSSFLTGINIEIAGGGN